MGPNVLGLHDLATWSRSRGVQNKRVLGVDDNSYMSARLVYLAEMIRHIRFQRALGKHSIRKQNIQRTVNAGS